MKYDLSEILNAAIMSGMPALIVEGKDDVQFYDRVAEKAGKEVAIYLINTIEEFAAGCDSVIKCIHRLQPKFEEREDNIKRILGCIDRDVRPYRQIVEGEIDYRNLYGLHVLKYYSYETYFANRHSLQSLINKLTYLTSSMIDNSLLNIIESGFNNEQEDLYYISLEALQNACEEEYGAILGYHDDGVNNQERRSNLTEQLLSKRDSLNDFANEKDVSQLDLKLICKGKWYLNIYLQTALHTIRNLRNMCGNGIPQCPSCQVGNSNDCRYSLKSGYQLGTIYNDVFEYVDEQECEDIIGRIRQLQLA